MGTHLAELAPAVATLAIAVATTTIDPTYGFYLVLVAGFVAFTYRSTRVVAPHLTLIGLALLAPIAFAPEGARPAIASALIFGPGVALVTATAIYLRRAGEARERAYREFANDAMELASRIRSRVGPAAGAAVNGPEWFDAPAAPVIPLRSVGVAKVVRAEAADEPASTAPVARRVPVGAVAIAASAIVAVAFTAALARDGSPSPADGVPAPTLARDAGDTTHSRTVAATPNRPARRKRDSGNDRAARATATPAAATAVATAAAPAAPDAAGGSGGASASPPPQAPEPAPQAATPVRPQTGQPQTPPPTPVQQAGPSGPVDGALGLAEQTAGPLVRGLEP